MSHVLLNWYEAIVADGDRDAYEVCKEAGVVLDSAVKSGIVIDTDM